MDVWQAEMGVAGHSFPTRRPHVDVRPKTNGGMHVFWKDGQVSPLPVAARLPSRPDTLGGDEPSSAFDLDLMMCIF